MAGGGRQAHTGCTRQASIGFLPLQRMRSRRSTNPGFPSPGLFPSQRFSRSQGFTPSKTLAGLFHPANAPGVPSKDRPLTSGSRGTRVVRLLRRRSSEELINPALPIGAPEGTRTNRTVKPQRTQFGLRCPRKGGQTLHLGRRPATGRTSSDPLSPEPRQARAPNPTCLPTRRPAAGVAGRREGPSRKAQVLTEGP
jgi:hypothetical protein